MPDIGDLARDVLGMAPMTARIGELQIAVDPRLEVMAVVQLVSDYQAHWPLLTQLDFGYRRDAIARFEGARDHPAVQMLNEILARPFSEAAPPFAFSGPPDLMLHVTPDFKLVPAACERPLLLSRFGNDPQEMRRFVAHLRDFALSTDFAVFYAEQMPMLKAIVTATAAQVAPGEVAALQRFYGLTKAGFNVLLVPLYHHVGYGLGVGPEGQPEETIYNVMGPNGVADGLPAFGSREYFRYMVRHEFSHSFVNPLTVRHRDLVETYDRFDEIADAMRERSYGTWEDAVNEHVIRAVTAWLAFQDGEVEGQAALEQEVARGFVFVPPLLAQLRCYARERDRYPTFAGFYPELLRAFAA